MTGTVQPAYLHDEHVSHSWHLSMQALLDYDLEHGNRISRKPLNIRARHLIAHNRNFAARLFLDKTDHEWLWFVDTDMGFEPDSVHHLLEVADPVTHPVVGALCFAQMIDSYDGMHGHRFTIVPTMYRIGHTEKGEPSFCYYGDYTDGEVAPVAATGGAFMLIHRTVLEKLRAELATQHPRGDGDHWFDQLYDQAGDMVGEDIAFCARVGALKIPMHVHTGVKTSHHKEVWLSEMDYVLQKMQTITIADWDDE